MSVNLKNAATDSNLTHILRLKSYSKEPPPSKDANAYKRPDSELNQNDNLSSGSGNIITPLEKNTKPPLKSPNIEPNPAFGEHFKEFEGKGAQAVAKLLQEKRGQVAGAFFREDLGYIDLVWGDSKKGLAHILERRTQQYGEQQALEFIHNLPRILQEAKFWREIEDKIELVTPTDMIVLGKRDNNKFVLTSFKDKRSKDRFVELENPQTGDDVGFTGKSVSEPQTKDDVLLPNQTNSTTTPQTSPLSIHQQALQARQAREQAKLEAERLEEQKQAQREAQEQERRTQAAKDYQQAQEQKQAQAGGKQNDKNLEIGKAIAMQKLEGYSSSVSLDDARIYPLDFVIVKTSDVKPNLNAGVGTQTRTQTNPQRIEEIAKDFKPTMVFNRGGFDDLPIILSDGQVIAGNHRAKGMQSFSPQSREAYEKAVLEHYNIKLQSDELLLRTPKEGLDKQEIINLAAASNEKRLDSIGDMLVSALGKYDAYITPKNLDSILGIEHTSAADLTNRLAKVLDKNSTAPSVEEPSLALLAHVARNTPRLNLAEALNHAQKTLDPAEFKTLKEMFSHNAPSFYLLMRDGRFPSLNLAPYLTPALQATSTALKAGERADNFAHILERLQTLLSSTHKDGTNAMVQLNPYAYEDMLKRNSRGWFCPICAFKGGNRESV
ncbi:hypothetical protein [Helicobacter bizzozeronii]